MSIFSEIREANRMRKGTVWFTGVSLAESGPTITCIPILPMGKFKIKPYGNLDLSEKVIDELIANFDAKALKHDIRIDIEHDFREAAGWITALSKGEFEHPVTGDMMSALFATVEWTATGLKLLGEKTYRYVSAAFGPYEDEESGVKYKNILKATALTNDPAMKMLPAIELSDDVKNAPMLFGDVVDKVNEEHDEDLPRELWAAAWGIWPATDAFTGLVREALADGLTGDDLKARVAELAADLPEALFEAIKQAVESEKDAPSIAEPADPVVPLDPTLGTSEVTLAADINGDASSGGETDMTEEQVKQLTQERDDALAKLAEVQRADREARIDSVLDKLSKAGIDEESRKDIRAALISTGMITLAEGKEIDREEALLTALSNAKWVPVTPEGAEGVQDPPAEQPKELSDVRTNIRKQLAL